jgi:hypothetical protein
MFQEPRKKGAQLADWKKRESEQTSVHLNEALDRFKSGKLIRLPRGSKLTRLNLATEAGVSKDTPFSRYRKGHPKGGEYRFPQVVDEFIHLRQKRRAAPKGKTETNEITKLKATNAELESMLFASRCVVNAQDIEIVNLRRRSEELENLYSAMAEERTNLEAEIIKLKRQNIRNLPVKGALSKKL